MMILNENERLRTLLREAAAWLIADPKTNPNYYARVMELRKRIHAALAAPPAPAVEWKLDPFWGDEAVEARAHGVHLSVHPTSFDERTWDWTVSRSEVCDVGSAQTKEEAVEAALAAFRQITT